MMAITAQRQLRPEMARDHIKPKYTINIGSLPGVCYKPGSLDLVSLDGVSLDILLCTWDHWITFAIPDLVFTTTLNNTLVLMELALSTQCRGLL